MVFPIKHHPFSTGNRAGPGYPPRLPRGPCGQRREKERHGALRRWGRLRCGGRNWDAGGCWWMLVDGGCWWMLVF